MKRVLEGFSLTIEGFEETLEEQLGKVTRNTEWEQYVLNHPEVYGLTPDQIQNFLQRAREYKRERRGVVPIELAEYIASKTIDDIVRLGGLQPFIRKPDEIKQQPQIRLSELGKSCALDAFYDRTFPDRKKDRTIMDFGSVVHALALRDPPAEMQQGFTPYYFLYADRVLASRNVGNIEPVRRSGYAEVVHYLEMNFGQTKVYAQMTPDAVFLSGKYPNRAVIFDIKSGLAPPFEAQRRHKRQVCGYAMGLEQRFGLEPVLGVIVYLRPLGEGFKLEYFYFDKELREEANELANEILHLQEAFRNPVTAGYYRGSQQFTDCNRCLSNDFCIHYISGHKIPERV